MKVLMLNGSTRVDGCTHRALAEVAASLSQEGIESEILQMGARSVRDCAGLGCGKCAGVGRCVFGGDAVNELIEQAEEADGFVFGTPVYYAHPSGQLLAVLDRAFYAGGAAFAGKPGAAVASARRAGTTTALDAVCKHFSDAEMPVVSSTYWNMVHGTSPDEVEADVEGLQTMRNLGRRMAWLLKCIEAGRAAGIEEPQAERSAWTSFVR